MIIWAGSWPRSGSTLLRIAWHTYTGLPTYSVTGDQILGKAELNPYLGQRQLPVAWDKVGRLFEAADKVHLVKTHKDAIEVDPDNTMCKILVVRDVRDAIVSLAHYTSWRRAAKFKRELRRIIRAEKWARFVGAWISVSRAVVRYEDLRSEPRATLTVLLDSLEMELPLCKREMPEFGTLHEVLPDFFRKGTAGEWRDVLTEAQEKVIWDSCGERMEQLGYER